MQSKTKPDIVEMDVVYATRRYAVNIDIYYDNGIYEWERVEIPAGRFDYGGIIDALVTFKYPIDKMQSVINNYLLEPENEEYILAFNEMQAWRKEAKEIAKQALEYELH